MLLYCSRHPVVYIFPFPLGTAQLIAISGPIGEVQRRGFRVFFRVPYVAPLHTIGATIHPPLLGKQWRTKKIREISLTGTSPISARCNAEQIILSADYTFAANTIGATMLILLLL